MPVSNKATTRFIYQGLKTILKTKKKDFVFSMGQRLLTYLKKNKHFLANAIHIITIPIFV